jgi:drug/metabolite transporter (DMT)-like permease
MSAASGASDTRPSIDTFAAALMIGLTFSWGLNQVAVKLANVGFNPVFSVLARSALAGLLVLVWCRYRRIDLFRRDGTLWAGILAGVLFGAEFALIFMGLDYTSAARGALMINTMPFWVLLGAHFVLGEHMTVRKFVGLLLAFAGVVLVFVDELSLPGPDAIIGDLMCLAAGALWGATTLVIKGSRLATASAEKTLLYQLGVSALFVAPFVTLAGPVLRDVGVVPVGSIIFQSVFIVAFTYVLWFWLVRRYPASGLSSFAFLTPAFGVLMGGLLLNEPLSVNIFVALALIGAGIVIVNRPSRRRSTTNDQ